MSPRRRTKARCGRHEMRSAAFVVPGRLDARTGGSIYDRRMVEGLRALGWAVDVHELDDSFPRPSNHALAQASSVLAGLRRETIVVVDGLALGAMPCVVQCEASRLRLVALVHLPLALEVGLSRELAEALEASERLALTSVRCVIVTGRSTVDALAAYGVHRDRIVVIEPGTDPVAPAIGGGTDIRLLCVATVSPGKGHELLVRALASIEPRNWTLTCAGNLERYPSTVSSLRQLLTSTDLDERIVLTGELDAAALDAWYARSDLFVLATRRETYGMVVAEALARGLPIVSTMTGAIPDLVGTEAGLLVAPGDEHALADALSRAIGDVALRSRLKVGAMRARDRLESWDVAVGKMAAALTRVSLDG
jgi:glycosyltransferase involved in cell wall biosynthesis